MQRHDGKLNPHEFYSSWNKHVDWSVTYGGNHVNVVIDCGNDIITWLPACPFLLNKMDISPEMQHPKPWCSAPALAGRILEPQHQAFSPTVHKQGLCSGWWNGNAYKWTKILRLKQNVAHTVLHYSCFASYRCGASIHMWWDKCTIFSDRGTRCYGIWKASMTHTICLTQQWTHSKGENTSQIWGSWTWGRVLQDGMCSTNSIGWRDSGNGLTFGHLLWILIEGWPTCTMRQFTDSHFCTMT